MKFFGLATVAGKRQMKKIDSFIYTYLRCFTESDQIKLRRNLNLHKLASSIFKGPVSFMGALTFPYSMIYSGFA